MRKISLTRISCLFVLVALMSFVSCDGGSSSNEDSSSEQCTVTIPSGFSYSFGETTFADVTSRSFESDPSTWPVATGDISLRVDLYTKVVWYQNGKYSFNIVNGDYLLPTPTRQWGVQAVSIFLDPIDRMLWHRVDWV